MFNTDYKEVRLEGRLTLHVWYGNSNPSVAGPKIPSSARLASSHRSRSSRMRKGICCFWRTRWAGRGRRLLSIWRRFDARCARGSFMRIIDKRWYGGGNQSKNLGSWMEGGSAGFGVYMYRIKPRLNWYYLYAMATKSSISQSCFQPRSFITITSNWRKTFFTDHRGP